MNNETAPLSAVRVEPVVSFALVWHPNTMAPLVEGDYILYNRCDGFHIVESTLDDNGDVVGFHFFAGKEVARDFYTAWALLPTTAFLYRTFVEANAPHERAAEGGPLDAVVGPQVEL